MHVTLSDWLILHDSVIFLQMAPAAEVDKNMMAAAEAMEQMRTCAVELRNAGLSNENIVRKSVCDWVCVLWHKQTECAYFSMHTSPLWVHVSYQKYIVTFVQQEWAFLLRHTLLESWTWKYTCLNTPSLGYLSTNMNHNNNHFHFHNIWKGKNNVVEIRRRCPTLVTKKCTLTYFHL